MASQMKPSYPYTVVGTAADGSEIRKIPNATTAADIDRAIATANIRPDQTAALVVTYEEAQTKTIRGAIMVKKTKDVFGKEVDFSFVGTLSHDFTTGDNRKSAGLVIRL